MMYWFSIAMIVLLNIALGFSLDRVYRTKNTMFAFYSVMFFAAMLVLLTAFFNKMLSVPEATGLSFTLTVSFVITSLFSDKVWDFIRG